MHGNPWLRLLRREVEALVKRKHGANYLKDRQAKAKTELARVTRELRRLKAQMTQLEERKAELIAAIGRRQRNGLAKEPIG
jgi:chromosome segregation ATPase